MFKRPNVRAEKLLFRISENMLNRWSDIANDTVRHDNHRGAKGVGQEVAKQLFLLQHAELARSIAKVQQPYLTIVVQPVTLPETLDRQRRPIVYKELNTNRLTDPPLPYKTVL